MESEGSQDRRPLGVGVAARGSGRKKCLRCHWVWTGGGLAAVVQLLLSRLDSIWECGDVEPFTTPGGDSGLEEAAAAE